MCLKTFDNRALDKTSPDLTISGRLVFSTNIWHNELRMIGVSFFPQNDFLANLMDRFVTMKIIFQWTEERRRTGTNAAKLFCRSTDGTSANFIARFNATFPPRCNTT